MASQGVKKPLFSITSWPDAAWAIQLEPFASHAGQHEKINICPCDVLDLDLRVWAAKCRSRWSPPCVLKEWSSAGCQSTISPSYIPVFTLQGQHVCAPIFFPNTIYYRLLKLPILFLKEQDRGIYIRIYIIYLYMCWILHITHTSYCNLPLYI